MKINGSIYQWIYAITITTVMALKIPNEQSTAILGIIKSRVATSFENLVKILPIGFESKNKIYARITFSTILLCIFVTLTYKIT